MYPLGFLRRQSHADARIFSKKTVLQFWNLSLQRSKLSAVSGGHLPGLHPDGRWHCYFCDSTAAPHDLARLFNAFCPGWNSLGFVPASDLVSRIVPVRAGTPNDGTSAARGSGASCVPKRLQNQAPGKTSALTGSATRVVSVGASKRQINVVSSDARSSSSSSCLASLSSRPGLASVPKPRPKPSSTRGMVTTSCSKSRSCPPKRAASSSQRHR